MVEPRTHLLIWSDAPSSVWQRQLIEVEATTDRWTRLPVVLQPDFSGLAELEPLVDLPPPWGPVYGGVQRAEAWYQTRWGERLGGAGCVHFEMWGSFVTNTGAIPIQHDAAFDMTNAADRPLPAAFASECTP